MLPPSTEVPKRLLRYIYISEKSFFCYQEHFSIISKCCVVSRGSIKLKFNKICSYKLKYYLIRQIMYKRWYRGRIGWWENPLIGHCILPFLQAVMVLWGDPPLYFIDTQTTGFYIKHLNLNYGFINTVVTDALFHWLSHALPKSLLKRQCLCMVLAFKLIFICCRRSLF